MGIAAMLGVAVIFALFSVFITYNSYMFGDLFQVALRNGLAFVMLLPILVWRKTLFNFSKREWLLIGLYAFGSIFVLVIVTLAYLNAPIKTVLAVRYSISVIFSVFISALIFKEAIKGINIAAVLLGVIGIVIFAYPFLGFFTIGVLYALFTAFSFLFVGALLKKISTAPEVLMAAEFSAVAIVVGVFVLLSGAPTIIAYNQLLWLVMIVFSALLIVVTYLMVYGYRKINFNLANIILTSEIAFGLLFGYLLLGQTVTATEWVGIGLIAAAVVLPHAVKLLRR